MPAPSKIRMLFVLRECYPTHRVDVDVLFGKELLRRGHAIDFVMQAADEREPTGKRVWNHRTVWVGPTDGGQGLLGKLRKHWLALKHDLTVLRLARSNQYDAVQVKDKFIIAAVLALIARRRRLKLFYWLSYPIPEAEILRAREGYARYPRMTEWRGRVLAWLLYKWILPRADHVFVQSERMKSDLCIEGVDAAKMTPVPMGIDPEQMQASPAAEPQQRSFATLAYLGTLGAERRLDVLVDMLAYLRRGGMDVRLLLIGDGQAPADRALIASRAQALEVSEFVEITGFLPRSEAMKRLLQADVCLSPFRPTPILQSTSPTKLIEYLALGLPVVANDHPEQRMVLGESKAGVCVPWSGRHFARAVRWLLSRTQEERHEMGMRGQRWVHQNRTYGHIAEKLELKYLELLGSST